MTVSFNLLDKPWIPCLTDAGETKSFNLRDVLMQAHELREIAAPSPLETAALYRLCLVILHRVFGPKDSARWRVLWQAGQFDAQKLKAYFDQWHDHFDLFDAKHPFYQCADESELKDWGPLNRMLPATSKSGPTLFDHRMTNTTVVSPTEAARALVAIQAYALGYSGFAIAPCVKGMLFLVAGRSLFETLACNLIRYSPQASKPIPSDENDCPIWESTDPFETRSEPYGYLDYLTWPNRKMLLKTELDPQAPDGFVVTQMAWTSGPRLKLDHHDPLMHYYKTKKGYFPLSMNPERVFWRDSHALFMRDSSDDFKPPEVFKWLSDLHLQSPIPKELRLRFVAYGVGTEDAGFKFSRVEKFPLPLQYLEDNEVVNDLRETIHLAETKVEWFLKLALWHWGFGLMRPTLDSQDFDKALEKMKKKKTDREAVEKFIGAAKVLRYFWSNLEVPFRSLLEDLPLDRDHAQHEWRKALKRVAWQAFEQAEDQAGDSVRALKPGVAARSILTAGLERWLPETSDARSGA